MYLREFRIQNIKCFEDVQLRFPHDGDDYSGWIVLLGGNGMGKRTLLQAIAITLVGPLAGQRLLLSLDGWVRQGQGHGEFSASIVKGMTDLAVRKPRTKHFESRFAVTGQQEVALDATIYDQPQLVPLLDDKNALMRGPYAARNKGWFSCGYGPFRRLLGGASEESRLMFALDREARYVTLFREAAALTHCTEWLSALYSRSIDQNHPDQARAKRALAAVRDVIDRLLPGEVHITRVDSERVYFRSAGGAEVAVLDLSDGYRSFRAMAIDILRHLEGSGDLAQFVEQEGGEPRVVTEGVILIDEVDVHLHPLWQREIGFRLRRTFPRMQFIVTSHSPFVFQAASDGGLIVLRPITAEGTVEAQQPLDSGKGWRVDQILTSPLFGLNATRDEETETLIRGHADLIAKRTWGQLTKDDEQQLSRLTAKLDDRLTAPGETIEERELQAETTAFIKTTLKHLKAKK